LFPAPLVISASSLAMTLTPFLHFAAADCFVFRHYSLPPLPPPPFFTFRCHFRRFQHYFDAKRSGTAAAITPLDASTPPFHLA